MKEGRKVKEFIKKIVRFPQIENFRWRGQPLERSEWQDLALGQKH